MSATSMRTQQCGDLRPEHAGQTVTLCGWVATRREHGEHLAFIDVRDHTGVTQCVVDNSVDVRPEFVVRVTGVVTPRPAENVNGKLPTGAVEVQQCRVEVLNTAEPPPFPISERADHVAETTRLQYRYLDIRRERMQRNLRVRAACNAAIRQAMDAQGFVEPLRRHPLRNGTRLQQRAWYWVPSTHGTSVLIAHAILTACRMQRKTNPAFGWSARSSLSSRVIRSTVSWRSTSSWGQCSPWPMEL